MKNLFICLLLLFTAYTAQAQDDYYRRKAESYTRKGDLDRARTYTRYADDELDTYKTQLRYAEQADEKAAQYLKWAAETLNKN